MGTTLHDAGPRRRIQIGELVSTVGQSRWMRTARCCCGLNRAPGTFVGGDVSLEKQRSPTKPEVQTMILLFDIGNTNTHLGLATRGAC